MVTTEEKPSWFARLRQRRPGIDHLVKAYEAFTERYGNHFAASITYFSVLSLFPLLLISFSVAGFVLAGQPGLQEELRAAITESAPSGLRDLLTQLVDAAVRNRGTVGVIGLAAALYTGLGWMTTLRDALTAQWGQKPVVQPFLRGIAVDLLALGGLGVAMVVSFGLSAAGSGLADWLLRLVGLSGYGWAKVLLFAITTLLSLGANWLIFLWVIARLPRTPVSLRSAVRGAAAAAVAFEVLKVAGTIYLSSVTDGPVGGVVGPIVGLLVFANLVSRVLLFVTAWTATASENVVAEPTPVPGPAIIRPVVEVSRAPRVREAAGFLGAGALIGLALGKRR